MHAFSKKQPLPFTMITIEAQIEAVASKNVKDIENILNSNRNTHMTCTDEALTFELRFSPTIIDIIVFIVKSPMRVAMTACLRSNPAETSVNLWTLAIHENGKPIISQRLDCTPEMRAKGPFDMIRVDVRKMIPTRPICIASLIMQTKHAEETKLTPKTAKTLTTPSSTFYPSTEKDRAVAPISCELKPTKLFTNAPPTKTSPCIRLDGLEIDPKKSNSSINLDPKKSNSSTPSWLGSKKTPTITPTKAPTTMPLMWNDNTTNYSKRQRTENSYNELLFGCVVCPVLTDTKMLHIVRRICDVTGALFLEEPMEDITHLLTMDSVLPPGLPDVTVVHVSWLLDSFSMKKKLDEREYSISR